VTALLLGHRGDSANHAENSLEAFRAAVGCGADGVELDVRLSADGEPVVIHDATLDRTTAAAGPVDGRGWRELGALGVPLLRDALRITRDHVTAVELKPPFAGHPTLARQVVDLVPRGQRILVLAYDAGHLRSLRDTGAATVLLTTQRPPDPQALLRESDAHMLAVQWQAIDAALCAAVAVHAWTVDAEEDVRALLAMGVAGVITNRPCAMRAVVPRG
jgi:glycerophosphoryl diester phosphodiesterase